MNATGRMMQLGKYLSYQDKCEISNEMERYVKTGGGGNDPYMWRIVNYAEDLIVKQGYKLPPMPVGKVEWK